MSEMLLTYMLRTVRHSTSNLCMCNARTVGWAVPLTCLHLNPKTPLCLCIATNAACSAKPQCDCLALALHMPEFAREPEICLGHSSAPPRCVPSTSGVADAHRQCMARLQRGRTVNQRTAIRFLQSTCVGRLQCPCSAQLRQKRYCVDTCYARQFAAPTAVCAWDRTTARICFCRRRSTAPCLPVCRWHASRGCGHFCINVCMCESAGFNISGECSRMSHSNTKSKFAILNFSSKISTCRQHEYWLSMFQAASLSFSKT